MFVPWLGILLVLVVLGGVMIGLKLISARCHLHPETSRKAVHIAMGLVTLSFPWLFTASWPVLLLADGYTSYRSVTGAFRRSIARGGTTFPGRTVFPFGRGGALPAF